ncbi:hypothetical protein HHI36_003549 [Cryptolaemus montrouzieri]|uniref:Regulation of nuclear pre-mRNA domain-containing protein 2 n=1 Tax=Cryptolaemus montrouzieri TaxID=559131 RepID=A0ABD2PDR1_9CUCU
MGTDTEDFNVLQFEKKLTSLKDSQESINSCCQWCLSNRQHHKKIVNSWLNVLKRVKVEHRLILFYLANDVIQYSKRRKYEYVESWGTALQKATTLVRDDRVKQKILRIFKIWEDRGVYNEEFISDLCGLISVTPTAPKNDEPHEFQATYVINKIRVCSNLESDTDLKLKKLKELNPKIIQTESYYSSLKDRAHLDDTEKELETYVKHMEDYINALKAEVKNRITLISVLKQAEVQLDTDRKDVKIVANAYKAFGTRVKTFQKKLEDHKANLVSPIPSPDINAPSPSSDSDIDLPDGNGGEIQDVQINVPQQKVKILSDVDLSSVQITNANYYNPVPAPSSETSSQYAANGFTSFMTSSLPFNLSNFNTSGLFSSNTTSPTAQTTDSSFGSLSSILPVTSQPPPSLSQPPPPPKTEAYSYATDLHSTPLLPPPMPPFGSKDEGTFGVGTAYETGYEAEAIPDYGPNSFSGNSSYSTDANYAPSYNPSTENTSYDPISTLFGSESAFEPPIGANPYPPSEEYNPEEELQTWEGDLSWTQPPQLDSTDTPESPPPFEKEAYGDPIEYHDNIGSSGAADVDHRVLPPDLNESDKLLGRGQDVDHRNLISLIGSPATDSNSNQLSNNDVWTSSDQDYRNPVNSSFPTGNGDQDYRLPFDIEQQLKLPPPPPPPNPNACPIPVVSTTNHHKKHLISFPQDNVESIDMELSDDDVIEGKDGFGPAHRDNLRVVVDGASIHAPSSIGSNSNLQSIQSPEGLDSQQNSQDGMPSGLSPTGPDMIGQSSLLEPPPPLPELPDDAEENMFLDQMSSDINDFLLNDEMEENLAESYWNNDLAPNHMQPPPMFPNMASLPPPPMVPPPNWMGEPPPSFQQSFNNGPFQDKMNKRGRFNNDNRGMRGGRGGFNDNGHFNYRGGMNNFRGRGRGNPRFSRGNFRGNFRGYRGGF